MEWLLQNEVKKLTAESRVKLLQSEKQVRHAIHALRYKIEDWVRKAEQSLLQDLQDIVHSHEQKIDELENSVSQSDDESKSQLKRRLIMKRLAFQPVSVTLETNETLENLLKQSSSLGIVKSVSSKPHIETTVLTDLNLCQETNSDVLNSITSQDGSYVVGRVAATRSEELPRTKQFLITNDSMDKGDTEVYSYVDDVSSWLPVGNTVETFAYEEETIPKTVERRRKKTLRKSATVLMRERNSLEDIKEENIANADAGPVCSINKTREGIRYINSPAHHPNNEQKNINNNHQS